jgi:hypothetical protein
VLVRFDQVASRIKLVCEVLDTHPGRRCTTNNMAEV